MKKIILVLLGVFMIGSITLLTNAYADTDISGIWTDERHYSPGGDNTYYRIRKFGDEFFAEPYREDNVKPMPVTYKIRINGYKIEAMVTEDLTRSWANGRTFTHVASGSLSSDGKRMQLEYMSTMPTGAYGDRVEGWQELPVTVTLIKIK